MGPLFVLNSTGKCEKGAMYHLTVSICENEYPFALIPTDNWYMDPIIALNSTYNCDRVPSSNLKYVHLPQKSTTVKFLFIAYT